MARHFYLSPESSYVEGEWQAYPFQIGMLDLIGNDDVREINIAKSARIGYTKAIIGAMGYFIEHKKRNVGVWRPTDDDMVSMVKTEIEPMIRDCPVLRDIFPHYGKKHKNNTIEQKLFANGRTMHTRGGKAAKNYRAISVDVAITDELAGFDSNIEREGDPRTLAGKRTEGSTFSKLVNGSTLKIKGECLMEAAFDESEIKVRYAIPCPHCGEYHYLTWGGPKESHGMKWESGDDVMHMCPHCAALYGQSDYLNVWERGRWQTEDGMYLDGAHFYIDGEKQEMPESIGMHIWTAYSPQVSWAKIVKEFIKAKKNRETLKTFINTTLGETFEEEEAQKIDSHYLALRREEYNGNCPEGVQIITFGADMQDDRIEIQFDGWGTEEERWSLAYKIIHGDPSRPQLWKAFEDLLRATKFRKRSGAIINPIIGCMDSGGHFTDEVYEFSKKVGTKFLIPVKGLSTYGNVIADFPSTTTRKGVYLTKIGTDTAKNLLLQRMGVQHHGPGYWHFPISEEFDDEYFKQLTAEERRPVYKGGIKRHIWDSKGRRNEPWDCSVYSLAAVRIAQQNFGVVLSEQTAPQPQRRRRGSRKGVI